MLYLRAWSGGKKFSETLKTFKLFKTKSFLLDFVDPSELKPCYLLDRLDNLNLSLIGDRFL